MAGSLSSTGRPVSRRAHPSTISSRSTSINLGSRDPARISTARSKRPTAAGIPSWTSASCLTSCSPSWSIASCGDCPCASLANPSRLLSRRSVCYWTVCYWTMLWLADLRDERWQESLQLMPSDARFVLQQAPAPVGALLGARAAADGDSYLGWGTSQRQVRALGHYRSAVLVN